MGTEDNNKALVRRVLEEAFNKGNLAVVDEAIATNYVSYDPAVPTVHGPAGLKQLIGMYRSAFPDVRLTVEEIVAIGDTVVTRWSATGTHRGPFSGVPPTGRKATVTGMQISHFANGKVVEDFVNWDTLGLMRQLGVIPEAAPASVTQSAQAQQH
jgi:steroid delta-isomerase-like uncharacterized protein